MREGWEIKKLGEVATFKGGGTPSKAIERYYTGNIPWASVRDMKDFRLSETEFHITNEAVENSATNILPKGTIIISTHVGLGKICIIMQDTAINQDLKGVFLSDEIHKFYFSYWYQSISQHIIDNGKGATVKGVTMQFINSLPIPVPPLSEQTHIVAELDLLNDIIDKKRQQLKELDALSQSIFYDMFGDPVTNERGWKTKPLGSVGVFARGISKHRPRNAPELLGGTTPLIQTGDVANAGMYIRKYNSTYSDLGVQQSKIWKAGTLCITIAATIGKCAILSFDACFPDSVVGYTIDSSKVNNEYIYFLFQWLQSILEENAPAVAQKNINLKILNSLIAPVPPLALQQQFASRITAIEHQKQLIQASLSETETLLQSRMDYYFN